MSNSEQINVHEAVKLFIRTDRMHRAAIESRVKQLGIHRSQHIILMYLSKRETPPTQAEIAKDFEISPAAVTVTLKKLESANLVERFTQSDNCRAKDIIITEEGRRIVAESEKIFSEVDKAMFGGITDDELIVFNKCMQKMTKNMKALLPECEDISAGSKKESDGER